MTDKPNHRYGKVETVRPTVHILERNRSVTLCGFSCYTILRPLDPYEHVCGNCTRQAMLNPALAEAG